MGRKSPGREAAAHRQGSLGDVPGWEKLGRGISADCRLVSKSRFPGQASHQGLAIPARRCHSSTGLLPALGQPSRVEEEEEEEGASQHPVVLVVSAGVSGHPRSRSWRWESQPQPRDGYSDTLVPPSQAPGGDPGEDYPGFLGNKASLPAILPGVWLVLPAVPGGAGAATSLQDAAGPAGLCRSGRLLAAHVMPPSGQQLPWSSPAPCVGCRTEGL